MTFKTDMDADLDNVFINPDEFAVKCIYKPTGGSPANFNINGIFDREYEAVEVDAETPVTSTHPAIRVKENDLIIPLARDPIDGDKIQVNDPEGDIVGTKNGEYSVIDFQPDGVGTTILLLHEI